MRLLIIVMLAGLTVGCSVQAKVRLNTDGTAQIQTRVQLSSPARDSWKGLRELDPSLPVDPLDPVLLQRGLGPGSSVAQSFDSTNLTFLVADPSRLLPTLVSREKSWDLELNRESLRRLAGLTVWSQSPAVESLLPAPGSTITEEDYRDLLVYLLGPGLDEKAARSLIERSTVEVTLEALQAIKEAPGSVSVSGRIATYRWPLIRVLALARPLRLHLSF